MARSKSSTRRGPHINMIRFRFPNGAIGTINPATIKKSDWFIHSGKASNGVEVHSIHTHRIAGTNQMLFRTNRMKTPIVVTMEELEILTRNFSSGNLTGTSNG